MKKIFIAAALTLLLASPAAAVPGIYTVTFEDGHEVQVTELIEARREKIHPANGCIGRKGKKYWVYKVANSDDTIRLYKKEHKRNKEALKGIPENIPYEQTKRYQCQQINSRWQSTIQNAVAILLLAVQAYASRQGGN